MEESLHSETDIMRDKLILCRLTRKKTHIEAHACILLRVGNLQDLGKFKVSLSRDFYQASSGIEGFLRKWGEAVAGRQPDKQI